MPIIGFGELEEIRLLRLIEERLHDILRVERRILRILEPVLSSARIKLMPKTIDVGQTALASIQGLDQNGQPFPLDATYTVVYAASSPSDVSFGSVNPDGSVTVTGVNPNTGVSISAVITRPDGGTVNADADTLVINQPAPVLTTAKVVLT